MTERELCARNVSAALRETLNAANCARVDRADGKGGIDDQTAGLIDSAAECLERAVARLAKPADVAAPAGDAKSGN